MDAAEALESEAGAALPRLLEARGIEKEFPGVRALKSVDLLVGRGEIVGLVGENGAGKSTLAKVIAGVHPPDEGTLAFDGEERTFSSTRQAEAVGIVMIPQELQVAPRMSIAENMFMGALPTRGGVVDRGLLFDGTKRMLEIADERVALQVEARCWCGARATHNARVVGGEVVYEGDVVVVGDTSEADDVLFGQAVRYELLCRRHYFDAELGR